MKFDFINISKMGKTDLCLIGRDVDEGERYRFKIRDFFPYFYVPEDTEIPDSKYIKEVVEDIDKRGLFGTSLKKIVVTDSAKVPEIRERIEEHHYEADVLYHKRARCDMNIFSEFEIEDEKVLSKECEVSWRDVEGR